MDTNSCSKMLLFSGEINLKNVPVVKSNKTNIITYLIRYVIN